MNLKKKVLMLTSVVLILGLASLGIMAYLTDQDSARNVFTVGNIDIELDEVVDVVGSGEVVKTEEGAEYSGVMPGDKLQKEVTVSNEGDNDAYVRVIVKLNNALEINNAIDEYYEAEDKGYTAEQIQAVYNEVFDGWGINYNPRPGAAGINDARGVIDGTYGMPELVQKVDFSKTTDGSTVIGATNWFIAGNEKAGQYWVDEAATYDGYYTKDMEDYEICYAYYAYLKPGEKVTLFDGLNVPNYFDAEQLAMFEGLVIDVKAEAIQAANIGTGTAKADFVRAFELFEDPMAYKAVTNSEELAEAIANGEDVYLNEDVKADEFVIAEDKSADIDLNGNKIEGKINNKGDMTVSNGTVEANFINNFGEATFTDVEMTAGTDTDYANIARAGSETTYNNVDLTAKGGGIGVTDGAEAVFNSGSVDIVATTTSPRYNFYIVGDGSKLTINGGEFSFSKTTLKRAYIYAGEGTTVTVNGGTFGPASTRDGYTAGILGNGTVVIKGGTFGFDPSKWVASGYEAVKDGSVWTVSAK